SLLLTTACSLRLLRVLAANQQLVEVNKFHHAHFSIVAKAVLHADDARVSTRALCNFRSHISEKLHHCSFILQVTEHLSARMSGILFTAGDDGLNIYAQSFCFSHRSADAL